MFLESANLILKHSDISSTKNAVSASSTAGSWSNGKQKTTWRVNLRELIGSKIYDANELYVLRLNQISNGEADFPNNVIDQSLIIRLNGLQFINSTYNVKTGNNTSNYDMLLYHMPVGSQTINYSPNISLCNFKKSGDYVELTIELIRMIDDMPAEYGAVDKFPHMCYSFDIYAIEKN